jgi:hypothetical protein
VTESPDLQPRAGDSVTPIHRESNLNSTRRAPDLNSPEVRKRWALEKAQLQLDLQDARAVRVRRMIWSCLVVFFCLDIAVALWLSLTRL